MCLTRVNMFTCSDNTNLISTMEVRLVKKFRKENPNEFLQQCKSHLSRLIDLPAGFAEYNPTVLDASTIQQRGAHGKWMARIVRGGIRLHALKRKRSQSANARKTNRETGDVYGNLIRLIEFLCAKEQEDLLKTEGIFRKSGNIARQRDLRNRIFTCRHLEFPLKEPVATTATAEASSKKKRSSTAEGPQFDASAFGVHDYASVLKSVLSDMQKPLLTSQLMPIFITLASLTTGSSSKDLSVGQAKQLTALRFLCLILPYRNQRLLHRLLEVLTRTLQHSDTNRMTSESLGTLFGPILFTTPDVSFAPSKAPFLLILTLCSQTIASFICSFRYHLWSSKCSIAGWANSQNWWLIRARRASSRFPLN